MSSELEVRSIPPGAWRECALMFRDLNYQQFSPYAELLAARRGASAERFGVFAPGDPEPIGVALARVRRVPMLPFGLAMIAAGPATRRDENDGLDRFASCVKALRDELVFRRGLVVHITAPVGDARWNEGCSRAFERLGMRRAEVGRAYRTMLIDVRRSLEDIEASLSHYWRRNLRRSRRANMHVDFERTTDAFGPVMALHDRMLQRKNFAVSLDVSFYAKLQGALDDRERLTVAQCRDDDGEVLSAIVLSEAGDTPVGLVGATSDRGAKIYASYSVFWAIIERLHQSGARWFDLGGIDPEENPGVYKFKCGMRGVDVTGAGPYLSAPNRALGALATRLWRRAQVKSAPRS